MFSSFNKLNILLIGRFLKHFKNNLLLFIEWIIKFYHQYPVL